MSELPKPRQEFLKFATDCGAVLTGKPDGTEAVAVLFSVPSWQAFDITLNLQGRQLESAIYELSVAMGSPAVMGEVGDMLSPVVKLAAQRLRNRSEAITPIPMILHCPKCGLQHIDEPERSLGPGNTENLDWNNPPHRSHLCHGCSTIWRPADVATTGVETIQTRGEADTYLVQRAEQCPAIDLDLCAWETIKDAAAASPWIPPQYYQNDWVADVCAFLKDPVPADREGWQVVPIEPDAAMQKVQTWDFNSFYSIKQIWAELLKVAPKPK